MHVPNEVQQLLDDMEIVHKQNFRTKDIEEMMLIEDEGEDEYEGQSHR